MRGDYLGKGRSVKQIVLMGVFWRILAIEAVLFVFSLAYRIVTQGGSVEELFWYALRIAFLVLIIIIFMIITLRNFLVKKLISPLETIALANKRLKDPEKDPIEIVLPDDAPLEIKEIVATRAEMLEKIREVSEERLKLADFIKETFGRYLSKKVVDEILKSPDGLKVGGSKETVTILMADLRGFTGISEQRAPEEMVELLNGYLKEMSKVILSFDGIIDEFIGDAILAIFGVPHGKEDHAARAVACALSMQKALERLNTGMGEKGFPLLEMGIGVNTGEVIVGNIGSEIRMKYGVVGPAVNIAGRIESNTTGGQVLIGESTYDAVKDMVEVEGPYTFIMKGLGRPLVCYSVLAIGPPYKIRLKQEKKVQGGAEMRLPFHCWKLEGKSVEQQALHGETMVLFEDELLAVISPLLVPFTDIKILFDFCPQAHCFDEMYAKIISVEEYKGVKVNRLRLTSIRGKDRQVLRKWMAEAA